ncbi:XdhC/CoxI family protein [Tissierella carlieri]|uniref:XdhC family protein n=1 Tax=Tissierella TaxID=41273 RepID=UPI0030DA1221
MADLSVMRKALVNIENGEELAIATITRAEGSAPRREGAIMAVLEDGSIHGTIGGGALEKRVIELSLEAIKEGTSYSINLPLHTEGLNMICGGEVDIFIDVYKRKPKLLIVGGGHVGYSIYQFAGLLNFDIVIFEDREEFLSAERFSLAHELVLGNIKEKLQQYPIDRDTYIVIVTRGHAYDEEALEAVVNSDARYIGAMGSKKKVMTMMRNLKEKGISEENLNRVYAPIGIKISDGSPEAIALSILSEIQLVRNDGALMHMKDALKK